MDLVIVDLYPFEETVASTSDETAIIEKIDIGGPSMIRAAAKKKLTVTSDANRPFFSWSSNQALMQAIKTYSSVICRKLISSPRVDEKLNRSKNTIALFMNRIIPDKRVPTPRATSGKANTQQSNISPARIRLDTGTAMKLVSRKRLGNWPNW